MNEGFYCHGKDDGKSESSTDWHKLSNTLKVKFEWIPAEGERKKNLVDNEMIDAIEERLNHPKSPKIDVWVIATSDGDFCPIVKRIKEKNHKVIIACSCTPSVRLSELADKVEYC